MFYSEGKTSIFNMKISIEITINAASGNIIKRNIVNSILKLVWFFRLAVNIHI